ncbi:MAG: hypothetical protein ACTHKU_09325, partial [Verrucomicrobiota bacterium]
MTGKQGMRLKGVLDEPQVISLILEADGAVPNSALPLLIYSGAVKTDVPDLAEFFEELFESNDWGGTWRDGIYTYHHYHSTTHEVLG